MATLTYESSAWDSAWLDTPFRRGVGKTMEEATIMPGNCVKSLGASSISTQRFGRLVSYDEGEDKAVVRGHGDLGNQDKWVWTGTISEYKENWTVD